MTSSPNSKHPSEEVPGARLSGLSGLSPAGQARIVGSDSAEQGRDPGALVEEGKDRGAFIHEMSHRFRTPLIRFFEKRIGRQPEIEDLVQEVFLRLANGGRVESVEKPEAYLFRTAANLLQDRQRQLRARATAQHDPYEEEVHGSAHETLTPERSLLGIQALEQLVTALYELPERTRTIWVLYHLDDHTHAEIAKQLGITISAIEKHMARATARLLKRLEKQHGR